MKIGLLDSGVGGLSVLREIHRLLPAVDLHYVGDSAWCPYGAKSPETIRERVFTIADYLLHHGTQILVIACNTATIHGVGALRAEYPLPVVGMEPGVRPAAAITRTGVIGVLATEASLAGEKFHRLVHTHAQGVRVITRPCPRFVQLVEQGILNGPEVDKAIDEAIQPLLAAGADVMVLGCTHYPFLEPVILQRIPQEVQVVDTGPAVARRVASLLASESMDMAPAMQEGRILVETTGTLERLREILPRLLPEMQVESGLCRLGE